MPSACPRGIGQCSRRRVDGRGTIDLQHVTLYSLYATQRDFIEDRLEGAIGAILQHLPGDFVLHPDADPSLAAQQLAAWAPLLAFLRALGPEVPIARPLHEAQIPWELTEALRAQLAAMNPGAINRRVAGGDQSELGGLGILAGATGPGGGACGFGPHSDRQLSGQTH